MKKEGRQLDFASYPSVCDDDIQFLFIHQGISSSDFSLIETVAGLGVSAYAPNADAAIVAKIASIAIMVS